MTKGKTIEVGDVLEHRRSGRVRTVIKIGELHFVLENNEMGTSIQSGIGKRVVKADYKPIGITNEKHEKEIEEAEDRGYRRAERDFTGERGC